MRPTILRATLLILALALLPEIMPAQQQTYQTFEPLVKPKKRELYFYGMRAYPFGKIPQNARLEAIYHTENKMQPYASPQSINQWQGVGPFDIGGRVRSIAVHPTDGNTLWIGAADGGVWKSTNRGDSWTPVMDNTNAISMGALAVDPNNPNVIYAGTGEMSSNIDAYTGAGILKSIDGGTTWRPLGLTTVGAFSRIVVHPTNSQILFAGATKNNGGFYRSSDGGNTWKRTFTDPVSDVTINRQNPNQLWIGTMSEGVFRSDDGGETFVLASAGIATFGDAMGRISVQSAPSQPSTLYAAVHEADGALGLSRIYKSTNGGTLWSVVLNNNPNFLNYTGVAQGWYNNCLAIHPTDPNTVIAGGITIVRTGNGGTNWTHINTYAGGPHPDEHDIAFDPSDPNRVYLANDGGMYRSDNKGSAFQKKSKGLAITQFYAMAIDQNHPTRTYGGTQDNGTVTNGSSDYGDILGGDGFFVVVDPSNSNTVYAENPNGEMWRLNVSNNPPTGSRIMNGIEATDEAAWSAPLVMDPTEPTTLWHGRHKIYLTLDRGSSWFVTDGVFNGLASAIGVSPVDPAIVYGGSDRGELLVTNDQGGIWTDRTIAPGMPNRAITDLVPSNSVANTCFMSVSGFYSGHVFKTTDQGASWTDISNGLPDIPVNALALHPDDESILYAGTDIGVFITIDGGQSWAPYSQGLPRVSVADLEIHREERKLRMASHGRSMWEIELERPTLPPSILSPTGGETWMGGSAQIITWNAFDAPVRLEFSLDDGNTWHLLKDNVAGNSFRWNIFDTTSIVARIRVTSMGNSGQTATSNSFTILKFVVGGTLRASQVTTIPYGLAFDGEFLWASDFGSNRLLKLDPDKLTTVGVVTLEASMGPAYFTDMAYNPKKGTIYIHRLNDTVNTNPYGFMYEINKQGERLGAWASLCGYPIGLVYMDKGPNGQLLATDRNGDQKLYVLDAANPSSRLRTIDRARSVRYGSRGATLAPDGENIYQAITDFTGDQLQNAYAEKFRLETGLPLQCKIDLTSPVSSGFINVRGIELDPRDSNLWISDYGGNIYKIVSCDGRSSAGPPPINPGSVPGTAIPEGMSLMQNMPNPFSTTTEIAFTIPAPARVKVSVYDQIGKLVQVVADERFESGSHTVRFDPVGLPSGVYRYSMTMDNGPTLTRTMIYVR